MLRSITSGLLAALALVLAHAGASAATCTAEDFAAAVDKSGAQLRAFNAEALPKLQDKLKQLKEKKGWDEEKALDSVRDDRTDQARRGSRRPHRQDRHAWPPAREGLPRLQQAGRARSGRHRAAGGDEGQIHLHAGQARHADRRAGGKEVAAASKDPAPTAKEAKPAAPADATPPKPVAKSTAQKWATQTKQQPGAEPAR